MPVPALLALLATLAATPGVRSVAFSRTVPLTIRADQPAVALIARPVEPGRGFPLTLTETAPVPARATPVWVSEPARRIHGWDPGETIRLPIAGGAAFRVAGVWRDYSRQAGAVVVLLMVSSLDGGARFR